MYPNLIGLSVTLPLMVAILSGTQLLAAWAAVSRRRRAWRLIVPVVGTLVLIAIIQGIVGTWAASAAIEVLGLEMVKIALVLGIARRLAERRLTFSIREILVATTLCAVLLVAFRSREILVHLPNLDGLAIASVFSSLTIAALWAALSPIRLWQRSTALGLTLTASSLAMPRLAWPHLGPVSNSLIWMLLFGLHAFIVVRAAKEWASWHSPQTATAPSRAKR